MPAFQFYDLAPGASSDTHTLKWQHPSDLVLLVRSRVWAEPTPKDRKNPEARRAEGDSKAAGYAYNTFSVLLDGVPVPAKFCRTRPRVRKILAKGGSRAEPHREVALWGLTGGDVARFTAPWSTDFRATVISDDYMFQDMPDERVFRRCPCDRDRAVKPECDCRYVHAPLDDPYLLEFVVPYGVLEEGAGVDRPVTLQFKNLAPASEAQARNLSCDVAWTTLAVVDADKGCGALVSAARRSAQRARSQLAAARAANPRAACEIDVSAASGLEAATPVWYRVNVRLPVAHATRTGGVCSTFVLHSAAAAPEDAGASVDGGGGAEGDATTSSGAGAGAPRLDSMSARRFEPGDDVVALFDVTCAPSGSATRDAATDAAAASGSGAAAAAAASSGGAAAAAAPPTGDVPYGGGSVMATGCTCRALLRASASAHRYAGVNSYDENACPPPLAYWTCKRAGNETSADGADGGGSVHAVLSLWLRGGMGYTMSCAPSLVDVDSSDTMDVTKARAAFRAVQRHANTSLGRVPQWVCPDPAWRRTTYHKNIDGGGWVLVRRKSPEDGHPNKLFDATDRLAGDREVEPMRQLDGPTGAASFSLKFDDFAFDEFLFATGDGRHWVIAGREQLVQKRGSQLDAANGGFPAVIRKSHCKKELHTRKWYNRFDYSGDPFVSFLDHETEAGEGSDKGLSILYAGHGYNSALHALQSRAHEGLNVFVRRNTVACGDCFVWHSDSLTLDDG